ncbi:MAG TPA: cytochrome b5-like heme/steroid binding domain-containing protein [Oligoflexus sp.]|uniref:cytochrome b5-like heme/steroid binding domain-containing protein n=1 Tax=Oligoflexus sp. TaxID=1971216 RepID=UPI002D8050E1|nr:cytochrome b5-like heme/steroid binding domain-containing protein [Oligoflexus sp.]HET9236728.1 cytochrome b5-like heme/steroid binding domain-containing protein [Oligoflexus sp.]
MKTRRILSMLLMLLLGQGRVLAAEDQLFTHETVSKHNVKTDCWIIIDGSVYDITAALKDHLRYKYELDPWCGKEATQAWETKDGKGKAHSRKAQLMLKNLHKGRIVSP